MIGIALISSCQIYVKVPWNDRDIYSILVNEFRKKGKVTRKEMATRLEVEHTVFALAAKLKSTLEDTRMAHIVERARKEARDLDDEEQQGDQHEEVYPIRDWEEGELEKLVQLMNEGTTKAAAQELKQCQKKCVRDYKAVRQQKVADSSSGSSKLCRSCLLLKDVADFKGDVKTCNACYDKQQKVLTCYCYFLTYSPEYLIINIEEEHSCRHIVPQSV